jgi:inhibitor of growth protein 3
MRHQEHISNILSASTLLEKGPASPYTQALTISQAPTAYSARRGLTRVVNSPFGGRSGFPAVGTKEVGDGGTPTKKKKSRVHQLGAVKEDDDLSSVAGDKKKAPLKKRKP